MIEVLNRMLDQTSTVRLLTDTPVQHVVRQPRGGFLVHCAGGRSVAVDDLVLAASGPGSLRLLEGLPGTRAQRAALRGLEFHEARLALHTDPLYAHPNEQVRSFLNCHVTGAHCEASMWLASVLTAPPHTTAANVWKSWITHRQPPMAILHEATFEHLLPTPATLLAQRALGALQGRGGIWVAGGYTFPYDSQETALRSALGVALGLRVTSARCRTWGEAAELLRAPVGE
jgi:predicted NAD/FAD-binding protein